MFRTYVLYTSFDGVLEEDVDYITAESIVKTSILVFAVPLANAPYYERVW